MTEKIMTADCVKWALEFIEGADETDPKSWKRLKRKKIDNAIVRIFVCASKSDEENPLRYYRIVEKGGELSGTRVIGPGSYEGDEWSPTVVMKDDAVRVVPVPAGPLIEDVEVAEPIPVTMADPSVLDGNINPQKPGPYPPNQATSRKAAEAQFITGLKVMVRGIAGMLGGHDIWRLLLPTQNLQPSDETVTTLRQTLVLSALTTPLAAMDRNLLELRKVITQETGLQLSGPEPGPSEQDIASLISSVQPMTGPSKPSDTFGTVSPNTPMSPEQQEPLDRLSRLGGLPGGDPKTATLLGQAFGGAIASFSSSSPEQQEELLRVDRIHAADQMFLRVVESPLYRNTICFLLGIQNPDESDSTKAVEDGLNRRVERCEQIMKGIIPLSRESVEEMRGLSDIDPAQVNALLKTLSAKPDPNTRGWDRPYKPDELIFAKSSDYDDTDFGDEADWFNITPREFWEKEGVMWDKSLDCVVLESAGFSQEAEGLYSFSKSKQEKAEDVLERLGVGFAPDFQAFIDSLEEG